MRIKLDPAAARLLERYEQGAPFGQGYFAAGSTVIEPTSVGSISLNELR
jgi:hypothetical protein